MCDMLWSDGPSQEEYEAFGDVLAFDATYGRNRYNLSVIVLSGIPEIRGAIAEVFPEAHHRMCEWHLLCKECLRRSVQYNVIKRNREGSDGWSLLY
ncbi:hypothetical protein PIB30_110122 [Stylosanthes scabra]|uniref:Protein FAR1-RELATED SEQUENCE n=1 Tax=Stylosanthes scabra TaxID=79078 RepID=A0ABU6Z2S6_9FABA|nr:hypothetical protein [Stylosanthes scabra]